MNNQLPTFNEFLAKIEELKNRSGVDLVVAEDLSLAVMNLVSLEEHFFFTGVKTDQVKYFDTSLAIRRLRKELMTELMPNHEGETWCITKHLLSATMRLIEVGNKLQSEGQKDEAEAMFNKAYKGDSIFWALKLKLINAQKIKATAKNSAQLEDLVDQLANCCDE